MSHFHSSSYVHKPDQALRRAVELRSISQPAAALSLLHDVLSSRRHRTWSPTYEKIMISYLDLCMDLNRSREAKDGLHQYRNLSQSQAPGSLEVVIRHLIDRAEASCREAKAKADAAAEGSPTSVAEAVAEADVDLDGGAAAPGGSTVASLLLTTVSADPLKTQTDAALLLPRLRFLWESYRAVLDILRSNSKLERLYHATAAGALTFCARYRRRTEFRRLCDMLRMHLGNLQKYGGEAAEKAAESGGKQNSKVRGWEGWTTESIELHLQTRFVQLETASSLHLYTEGFRTVEDIYNILQISHSRARRLAAQAGGAVAPSAMPKAKLMAAYYEKLTELFWVSENYLFHAFAWYKFYTLCSEYNRGMTAEARSLQASAVLLSALCIPPAMEGDGTAAPDPKGASSADDRDGRSAITSTLKDDIAKEKRARMATLLGFHTRNPTREALLSEIRTKGVMDDVPPYLRELYCLLEENSDPLVLVAKARPLLDRLRTEAAGSAVTDGEEKADTPEDDEGGPLTRYASPMTSILLLKLIRSLSTSYHTISLDHVRSLTSGLGVTFTQVEKAIVSSCRDDETGGAMRVRIDHRANCLRFGDYATGLNASDEAEGSGGGKSGALESDAMRSQLTILSRQLARVCKIIDPPDEVKSASVRHALFGEVRSNLEAEHESMLARKDLIERRKEEAERLAQEKIKAEAQAKAAKDAAAKAEEAARLQREQHRREREKLAQIQKELDLDEKRRILKSMGRDPETMKDEELEAVDTAKLAKEHAEKVNKKKDEAERKERELLKRLDYIVRATRIEELPLVRKRYEEKAKAERERYEADIIEKAKRARARWEADCADKAVLSKHSIFDHMSSFEDRVMEGRKIVHQALCIEEDKRAELEAEKGKLERARKRKDEEEQRLKEEEERRRQEEEERRAAEEKARKEEERKRKEAEEAERRKKELERMAEAQKRKEKERQDSAPAARTSSQLDAASRGPGSRGGGTGGGPASGRGGGGRYVPPSRRGRDGGEGGGAGGSDRYGSGGGSGGPSRWGGGGAGGSGRYDDRGGGYGGGRYEGGGGSRWGGGDRGAGGGGGGGGDRYGDRRGGYDRDGAGGGDRYGDRGGDRGGAGGDRYGDRDRRSGGPPEQRNSRWS